MIDNNDSLAAFREGFDEQERAERQERQDRHYLDGDHPKPEYPTQEEINKAFWSKKTELSEFLVEEVKCFPPILRDKLRALLDELDD